VWADPTVQVVHSVDNASAIVAGSDRLESAAIFKRDARKEYKKESRELEPS